MSDINHALSKDSVAALVSLGENIRRSRILRGMTQKILCKKAGVARSTLQDIEKGSSRVMIENYVKVLEVMGMESHLSRIACHDKLWLNKLAEELSGRKRV